MRTKSIGSEYSKLKGKNSLSLHCIFCILYTIDSNKIILFSIGFEVNQFIEMDSDDRDNFLILNQLSTLNVIRTAELVQLLENSGFFKRDYTVRERLNPFEEYSEREFEKRYRLSKALVKKLYLLLDGQHLLEPQVKCIFF